jgi:hypothetical protein
VRADHFARRRSRHSPGWRTELRSVAFGCAIQPAIADAARLGDLLPVSNGSSVALDPELMVVEDATIVDTAAVSQLVR